jgi:hypothetical protein
MSLRPGSGIGTLDGLCSCRLDSNASTAHAQVSLRHISYVVFYNADNLSVTSILSDIQASKSEY